ncbi:hypothetical protein CCAX7_14500 [Capsulimonas corticalis]|uniref:Uncharacterized protein n=1 Tax=Capsulimonas corticalis TaxID=2219043 RepID=A0A402CZG3_9BACT|nr:hypothetical protein [Capsulimonas corticalis]BDI29399.1 hypothetical protein CCAX7_14500 [Capsulimonas corticalis]
MNEAVKTITIHSVKLAGKHLVITPEQFELTPENLRHAWEFPVKRETTAEDEYNASVSATRAGLIGPSGTYDRDAMHFHKGKYLASALVVDWNSTKETAAPYPVLAEFGLRALVGDEMTVEEQELLKKLRSVITKNT